MFSRIHTKYEEEENLVDLLKRQPVNGKVH